MSFSFPILNSAGSASTTKAKGKGNNKATSIGFDSSFSDSLPFPVPVPVPFTTTASSGAFVPFGMEIRVRSCEMKANKEALYMKLNMPGVPKGRVKVWMDKENLNIKGEVDNEKDPEYDFVSDEADGDLDTDADLEKLMPMKIQKSPNKYSYKIPLELALYQTDKIKAQMKDGVLKVVVPKVKTEKEEEEGVTNIQVN